MHLQIDTNRSVSRLKWGSDFILLQTAAEGVEPDDGEILTAVPLSSANLAAVAAGELPLTTTANAAVDAAGQTGDLDPQTGMFYVDKNIGETVVHTDGGKQQVVVIKGNPTVIV